MKVLPSMLFLWLASGSSIHGVDASDMISKLQFLVRPEIDETGFVTSIETMQRVRLSQLFSIELRMAFTVFELVFFLMFVDASFDFRVGRSCIRFLFLRVISLSSLSLLPLFFT